MVSADLQFVTEAACLVGVMLLAAVSNPLIGDKPMTRSTWLRLGGVLIPALLWLYIAGRGSTMFAIVVGGCLFAAALVVLVLGFTAGWRLLRGGDWKSLERQAAINFAGAGLFGLMAVACLIFGVLSLIEWQQGSANQQQYEKAPICSATVSDACLVRSKGTVVRKWAERSRGPHWVEVRVADQTQAIQVETAFNVWEAIVDGQVVELTSWKGQVAAVTAPGVGTMQTADSPQFLGIQGLAFVGVSVFACLLFLAGGVTFGLMAWAATKGVDPEILAA